MTRPPRRTLALGLLALPLGIGCSGDPTAPPPGPARCADSEKSGLWLLPFGPITQQLVAGDQRSATVIVALGAQGEAQGRPLQDQLVSFRLLAPGQGIALGDSQAATNADGVASVALSAAPDAAPATYQVEAALAGTCPQTFTFDVRRPLRQLRAATPNPLDAFTGARVPLAVEATTNGNAKLAGEEITFTLGAGKLAGMSLAATSSSSSAQSLKVTTTANGQAIVLLTTGFDAAPELQVVASMQGTADVVLVVRVAPGQSAPCTEGQTACPLGYVCRAGACEPPATLPSGGCTSNDHCQPPTICDTNSGACLQPTGKPCDPIEGTGCEPDEVCVLGACAGVPGACTDNGDCPATFRCHQGDCVPSGRPPTGGCVRPTDCPTNDTCVDGQCVPKASCNMPGKTAGWLQGAWQIDSNLHLRDALGLFTKVLLGLSGELRDILEGRFEIKGIPGFISDFVGDQLRKLMDQYVPPWGQQLIVTLGNIDDIVDDMHVISALQMTPVGAESYSCSEEWVLVEFDFKGQKISAPPSTIPEIGQVLVKPYVATETCGRVFFAKHDVNNVVGGIIKWAIGTALSIATCGSGTCYVSVDTALAQNVNCQMIAFQVDGLVQAIWSGAPSISNLVELACEGAVQALTQKLVQEVDGLRTKLSLLELSGVGTLGSGAQQIGAGRFNGVLGSGLLKGNFVGEFNAFRQ